MASEVRLRLLGGFEVWIDGSAVVAKWPTRRALELVQLLALAPQQRMARDQVIDALWPQLDAAAGAANLRKAAHHARTTLGDPRSVVLVQQTVVLFPDAAVTTDAEQFLVDAADALASTDTDPAVIARVVAAYTGELLPTARYDEWAEQPRRVLADRYRAVLQAGEHWEQVLELDPLDEVAARGVMARLLAEGHRHRAIGVYGRLRASLLHELGALPRPETEAAYAEALRDLDKPELGLVGRETELARVDAVLSAGTPGDVVLLRGEAGMGKSVFLAEVVRRADTAGWLPIGVVADEPGEAFAVLAAIVEQVLARAAHVAERLGPRTRTVLARLTPAVEPGDALEMPVTRHQLVGAVQRVLDLAAEDARGVLLVVDDAHRADESSLLVLAQLADREPVAATVLLAFREEAAHPGIQRAVAKSSRRRRPITVDLAPLAPDAVAAIARSVGATLDGAALERLHRRAQGNPFFALELCRAGGGTVADGDVLDASMLDAVGRRFLDLDEDLLAWLRRLALTAGALDVASVQALAGCDDDGLTRLLDVGLGAGVLAIDHGLFRFRHDLVRLALERQLAPHHRVAIHRDAARRLADVGQRPAVIAHHWIEGGRAAEATPWLLRAADDAVRLGGFPAALEHLDRVLQHAPGEIDALRRRAAALDAMGDRRVLAAYAALEQAVPAERDDIRSLWSLAQIKLGDPEGALRTVEGVDPQRLDAKLARALTYCGAAIMGHADAETGVRLAAEGRALALQSDDPSAVIVASWAQAGAAHVVGELRTSLYADLHDTLAIPKLAVSVFDGQLCITQRLLYGARPYDDVIRWAERFASESDRLGAVRGKAFATTLLGEAELLSGRLDAASTHLREGNRLHHDLVAPTGEAFALQRLAEVLMQRDDRRGARSVLGEALAVARESDVGFHLFDRIYGTRIMLAEDPAEALAEVIEAEELVQGPLETCPGCRITMVVPAAIAAARAGDLERAASYEAASSWLAEVVMHLPAWDASVHEVRAHHCLARGDRAGADAEFAAAATGFAAAGQPLDAARCTTHG